MELEKVKIHRIQQNGTAVSQITLDDDYNVPDYRPDIMKVLKENGELRFDEVKAANKAVWVKGSLVFHILYQCEQSDGKISCLKGEIPFQEKLNIDGLQENGEVHAAGEIEDLTVGVINSRKLSIRAVVVLRASAEEQVLEEFTSRLELPGDYQQKTGTWGALNLLASCRDVCRQKSEIVLPSNKPNVREILWRSVELRNVESHVEDGKAVVTGEILAAVLYSEEEESERLQWYETTVPLECAADCDAAGENCIFKISAVPLSAELEIKPDYDGEERILVLELSVSVDVRVWREEEMELLTDLYSLREKAVPVVRERIGERLLVKNAAKCRVTEQLEIPESQEKILQICACEGTVRLEKYEPVENGIRAEGTITAELLYITTDDNMPIQSAREIYPFSQILEIPDMQPDVEAEMDCGLEQLSAVMMDQEHIEIKAVIQLNLMAFLPQKIQNIEEITEEPLDMEELQNRPGLVGAMDIATANNTVAIVMANPIAKEMAADYGISNRKAASLLDTFSCVFQGIIPYGAQMLVAISAVNELGYEMSAFQILPVLFYPMMLLISSLIWIFIIPADR